MQWYVRHLDDGEVWGPMSQAEAEDMRDQSDGACMFNERIFEPRFVTTEEVELVLEKLKNIDKLERERIPSASSFSVAREAIDVITLLCKKDNVFTSSEIDELVDQLGPDNSPGGQCDPKVLDRVIDALVSLSRKNFK